MLKIKRLTFLAIVSKLSYALLFLPSLQLVQAQKFQTFKGRCGLYYKSMENLHFQKQKELEIYDFQAGQTVASVGAQCCNWEAAFAATTDSILFYLEDIDTTYFKRSQTEFAWNYYDSLRGRPMTSSYKMVIGDERSTSLPDKTFDKVIIINSFHEFTHQTEMLADIKKKLKPGGILYIDEALPKRPGELHGICKKPMIAFEKMIALLSTNGFELMNALGLNFRKKKPMRMIYAFKVKN